MRPSYGDETMIMMIIITEKNLPKKIHLVIITITIIIIIRRKRSKT